MMRRCSFPALGLQSPVAFSVATRAMCRIATVSVAPKNLLTAGSASSQHCAFRRFLPAESQPVPMGNWQSAVYPSRGIGGAAQHQQRRNFFFRAKNNEPVKIKVDEVNFDKMHSHWNGQLFGVPMDKVIYYLKINGGIASLVLMVYFFFKGYVYMSGFSLASVGRMGFMAGFWTSATLYTMMLMVRRNYQIAPNAVYNQAISLVMKDQRVIDHLGTTPRTGDFRAYCASGGFKFPLLRRLRSGQYSLGDALGTKQRKLQMMFLLQSPAGGQEGLVSCEVRKGSSGMLSSNYFFQSLHVHLTCPNQDPKNIILIGGEKDIVFKGIMASAAHKANRDK